MSAYQPQRDVFDVLGVLLAVRTPGRVELEQEDLFWV
jgi:hypothetical protein